MFKLDKMSYILLPHLHHNGAHTETVNKIKNIDGLMWALWLFELKLFRYNLLNLSFIRHFYRLLDYPSRLDGGLF